MARVNGCEEAFWAAVAENLAEDNFFTVEYFKRKYITLQPVEKSGLIDLETAKDLQTERDALDAQLQKILKPGQTTMYIFFLFMPPLNLDTATRTLPCSPYHFTNPLTHHLGGPLIDASSPLPQIRSLRRARQVLHGSRMGARHVSEADGRTG